MPPRLLDRPKTRRWTLAWTLAGVLGGVPLGHAGGVGSSGPRRDGTDLMASLPNSTAILVEHYDALLRDGDVEGFRRNVSARYNEATLARLLDATDAKARQAAVLSLGLFGGFAASNATVAKALKDKDPAVRDLAHEALWSIWFRADTPAHNETLAAVRKLIAADQLAEAIVRADQLIAAAPEFAEAYNQRAIAHFFLGHYAASAADCRRVLDKNPYHFGALGGLGQCLLAQNKRGEAVVVFQRALELQPFDDGLRNLIATLEAGR